MSADAHWDLLIRYAREEIAAGGPDPQIAIVAEAIRQRAPDDRQGAVMAGEFVNCYTVASAAVQWHGRLDRGGADPDLAWWAANWGADTLPLRKERRAVKSPDKLHRCAASWRRWVGVQWPVMRRKPYSTVYDSICSEVWGVSRYAAIKILETLHRAGLVDDAATDVRADGNPFGRRSLAALFPDRAAELTGNSQRTCQLTDELSAIVRKELRSSGVDATWYHVEVFLCTYRQALEGKYPGRSQDRELAYWLQTERAHGASLESALPFRAIRSSLFDPSYLGEVGGWAGARPDLEAQWKGLAGGRHI